MWGHRRFFHLGEEALLESVEPGSAGCAVQVTGCEGNGETALISLVSGLSRRRTLCHHASPWSG